MDIISVNNGKKGGRPSGDSLIGVRKTFKLPEFNIIILTENQYETLLQKYGTLLLQRALFVLANWINTSPLAKKYRGKNNYAFFRSDGWVINEARKFLKNNSEQAAFKTDLYTANPAIMQVR